MGFIIPAIFLGVSAFLLNIVLTRLIAVQREQIAALKALGYTNSEIGGHYVAWAMAIALLGAALGVLGASGSVRRSRPFTTTFSGFRHCGLCWRPQSLSLARPSAFGAGVLGAVAAVARAVRLPPAEAMRPEPPARHRLTRLDRALPGRLAPPVVNMILRNLQRQPLRAGLSALGMAFAVAILVVGMFSLDSIEVILDMQYNVVQRQDLTVAFVEPRSTRAVHELAHLPGVLAVEPMRSVPARIRAAHRMRQLAITGLLNAARLQRVVDASLDPVQLPPDGLVLSTKLADILQVRAGDTVDVELLEGARPTRRSSSSRVLSTSSWAPPPTWRCRRCTVSSRKAQRMTGAALLIDQGDPAPLYRRIKLMPAVAGISSKRAAIDNFRRHARTEHERHDFL